MRENQEQTYAAHTRLIVLTGKNLLRPDVLEKAMSSDIGTEI